MYDGHLTLHILGGSPGLEKALRGAAAPERLYCAWARFDSPAEEGWAACDVLVVDLPDGMALDAVARTPEDVELVVCAGQEELAALPRDRRYADLWVRPVPAFLPAMRIETLLHAFKERHDGALAQNCLDTAINSIPDLVWFKDVRGAHEKVNDAF